MMPAEFPEEFEMYRGPLKGVGHGGGRWKLNQVFSRFFKNPEKTRKKTCWKMWRVRRKLGIWWCRDGPGTYHSRTCQGKNPEKTRFNFSPTPSWPTPFSGKKKQHKHKLFGPDFPRTFLTLTPECPGVKKFLPITGAAEKCTFWCGRPQFSARTSMTRRVLEKLCTKKVCVDFLAPTFGRSRM